MSKKKSLNIKVIASIASLAVLGGLVGSYFIGYNVALGEIFQPVAYEPEIKLEGVYKRSYYNNYNKSVDSYAILREDGTCRYIESITTEYSAKLDFDDRSQQNCKYNYDGDKKSGKIEITYNFTLDGKPDSQVELLNFTFNNGALMIGGAAYSKIQ